MQRLVTARQMKEIDQQAMTEWGISGLVLMENAGRAVVDVLNKELGDLNQARFLIISGKGNNGGDGFVICRHLANRGAQVACVLLGKGEELKGDALANYRVLRDSGMDVREISDASELEPALLSGPVVIDAIFGTGLSSPPRGLAAEVIELVNRSGCFVAGVDVPSGVDADTGSAPGPAVRARLTVTMGLAKQGLWLYPGRACVGRLETADIGIPDKLLAGGDTSLVDDDYIRASLPARPPDGHKGTFGTAFIIAGSRGFSGAACLAGTASIRSGAGITRLAIPSGISNVVESRVIEAVKVPLPQTDTEAIAFSALDLVLEHARTANAVAVGPGIGTHPETRRFLLELLPRLGKPVVIDADGVNDLAGNLDVLARVKSPVVLTPHPGEFGRLTGQSPAQVNSDRIGASRRFAAEHKVVLVLKGASTVVADPAGRVLVNPTGNSGLGSGGTGDVLTGLIVGLMAQGMNPTDAAAAAVYLHGRAADLAAADLTEYCLAARDLFDYLPDAFRSVIRRDE